MKNFSTKTIAILTVFMMILSLAACSRSAETAVPVHNSKGSVTAEEYPESTAAAADAGADLAVDEMSSDMTMTYDTNNGDTSSNDNSTIPGGNMLIRKITMSISTENFDEMVTTIRSEVNANQGYFENMSVNGTGTAGDYKYGTFVIRVPADKLDSLTAALEGCGTVTSANESTEDVTLDYVDIQAHLDALRTEQESLMELLEEAEDLDTIVQLQGYLTDVRYEIEYYESQSRTLNNLVDYATLTLNITQVVNEEEPVEIEEVRNETLGDKMKSAFNESIEEVKIFGKSLMIYTAGNAPKYAIKLVGAIVIVLFSMGFYKTSKKKSAKKKALPKVDEPKKTK